MKFLNEADKLRHNLIRQNSLYHRYGLSEQYPSADSVEFSRYLDTEGILYYREMQETGVPFPPAECMLAVGGETDLRKFLRVGSQCYDVVRPWLPTSQGASVLDFGVGCGRTVRFLYRHLNELEIHGCDVDHRSIDFLDREMGFLHARLTSNAPDLPYDNNQFDFIYCISVFTHFNIDLMKTWIAEVHRILKPGGKFLVSLHGETAFKIADSDFEFRATRGIDESAFLAARSLFSSTGFVFCPQKVLSDDIDTASYGINFVAPMWFTELINSYFEVVQYDNGAIGGWQDVAVLKKV